MAGDIGFNVRGLGDLKQALLSIPSKLRRRVLRNALAAGARVVRDEARARAPVMNPMAARKAPHRTPGLLRKSIAVRTSKVARRRGDVGVFVNVKPAKAGQRGARSKLDPFYWRWQEFGARGLAGKAFLQAGAKRLTQALQVITDQIGPQLRKLNGGKDVQL